MSRIANAEGASPTPLPVQVPPITTVSNAAPPASRSGKPAATTISTRTPRRRVTTAIAAHPSWTSPTSHRPPASRSANRSRYAAIPPSSTPAVARTNPGLVPSTCSHTTCGWRARSAGVTWARSRTSWLRRPGVTACTEIARGPAVDEPQIRAQEARGNTTREVQIGPGNRRAHTWRRWLRGGSAYRCTHGHCRPISLPAPASLERQRRDRTGEEQQRRRSDNHTTRTRREALERGDQPSGHDSRVGMEPRRPRPAAGNPGRPRAAALVRSRHAP